MPGPHVPEHRRDDVYNYQLAEVTRKRLVKEAKAARRREALEARKRAEQERLNNNGGR
jgi:hypothetical protein